LERKEIIANKGKFAKGRKEILRYFHGLKLTPRQAIVAKCYDCMAYFADGKNDCEMKYCPLYDFMPYKKKNSKTPSREIQKYPLHGQSLGHSAERLTFDSLHKG